MKSDNVIQFPGETPWVIEKRDHDLLLDILRIHEISEELDKLGDPADPQKVKALGSALRKDAGDLLNIMRGLKTRGKRIPPGILAAMEKQLLELAEKNPER
jgi:hypothetical protein